MKLIVGLGNPGDTYKNTRHNVGFIVLDRIVSAAGLHWSFEAKFNAEICKHDDILFCKPHSFVNNSGQVVTKIMQFYKIDVSDLIVVNDDLDLEKGRVKKQVGASSAGHNGVESIIQNIGTKEFKRVRVGIGRSTNGEDAADYVLKNLDSLEDVPTLTLADLI